MREGSQPSSSSPGQAGRSVGRFHPDRASEPGTDSARAAVRDSRILGGGEANRRTHRATDRVAAATGSIHCHQRSWMSRINLDLICTSYIESISIFMLKNVKKYQIIICIFLGISRVLILFSIIHSIQDTSNVLYCMCAPPCPPLVDCLVCLGSGSRTGLSGLGIWFAARFQPGRMDCTNFLHVHTNYC